MTRRLLRLAVLLSAVLGICATAGTGMARGQAKAPSTTPAAGSAPSGSGQEAPAIPVDEIIKRFAQHESEFKDARNNYTYSQSVLVEDVAPHQGEFRLESEIVFTPEGRRYENVTYAPASSLQDFDLS